VIVYFRRRKLPHTEPDDLPRSSEFVSGTRRVPWLGREPRSLPAEEAIPSRILLGFLAEPLKTRKRFSGRRSLAARASRCEWLEGLTFFADSRQAKHLQQTGRRLLL